MFKINLIFITNRAIIVFYYDEAHLKIILDGLLT
jgi:hypothetical protein